MGSGHCGAETSRCNLKTSEYLHGAWNRRPASCEVRNHADLMSIAYNFTNTCYGADFDCRPEAFPCYKYAVLRKNALYADAAGCEGSRRSALNIRASLLQLGSQQLTFTVSGGLQAQSGSGKLALAASRLLPF